MGRLGVGRIDDRAQERRLVGGDFCSHPPAYIATRASWRRCYRSRQRFAVWSHGATVRACHQAGMDDGEGFAEQFRMDSVWRSM